MKKLNALLLMIVFLLSFAACRGNIKNVNIINVDSELYSEVEINSAIDITLKHFKENFKGCTLTEIQYVGDDYVETFDEWAKQYEAQQAIVLVSSFDVDSSGGDGSLNPNSTYGNWKWILTRDNNKKWILKTWGY